MIPFGFLGKFTFESITREAAAVYTLRSGGETRIRVRRSSDDTEQDFTGNEITDGTLATFCGAGDGFVVKWFDAAGNSYDATNATTTEQPQIVSSGSVILENGKPAIDWDGVNDFLTTSVSVSQPNSIFVVANKNDNGANHLFDGPVSRQVFLINSINLHNQLFAGTIVESTTAGIKAQSVISILFDAANSYMYDNGQLSVTGNPGTNNLVDLIIGASNAYGNNWNNTIQELILYDSDQSSNRTKIESNINDYYNIY